MPDYRVSFSASVEGIDKTSLDKAKATIQDYMSRNTKFRLQGLELPRTTSKDAENAIRNLNARVTELKGNLATIKFNTPEGLKQLDVILNGSKIKSFTQAKTDITELSNEFINLNTQLFKLKDNMNDGSYDKVRQQIEALKQTIASLYGQEGLNSITSQFGGDIIKIEETKNAIGELSGRIITIKGEGQEVNKVYQSWNSSLGQFNTTSIKTSKDFQNIQSYVGKVTAKLDRMMSLSSNSQLKLELERIANSLKNFDIYAESASKDIVDIENKMAILEKTAAKYDAVMQKINKLKATNPTAEFGTVLSSYDLQLKNIKITTDGAYEALVRLDDELENEKNKYNTATAYLSKYKTQLSEISKAEIELYKLKNSKVTPGTEGIRKKAIEAAEKNLELLKQQAQETRNYLDSVGKATQAENIYNQTQTKTTASKQKFNAETAKSNNLLKNFTSGMKDATARIMNYTLIYRTLWTVIRLFRNSVETVKELDKVFTDIEMVMIDTGESVERLKDQYAELAYEMSSTVTEVAEGANQWIRQGKKSYETAELLKASMVLSKVGAIESADATEYLTSVLNGYQKEASEAMGVVDAMSQVDVESASSVSDLAEALQRSANSARLAGVDFYTLLGWVAEVKEVTQKSAETIGNSFKSILSRMGSVKAGTFLDMDLSAEYDDIDEFVNDTEKALSKIGVPLRDSTTGFRDMEDVLTDVANKWEHLTDIEKNGIATAIAGTYQRENFLAFNFWRHMAETLYEKHV